MNEKKYKKRLEFQEKIISRQSEQIEYLKYEIEELKLKCKEKDDEIQSVVFLKKELTENIDEIKKYKKEYKALTEELRKMKSVINQEVYKNKWSLIKYFIK